MRVACAADVRAGRFCADAGGEVALLMRMALVADVRGREVALMRVGRLR